MHRLILSICLAMALTLCLSAVSHAHKVNVFAYVDGNLVVTDSGYSRSKRVHDGVIEVYDVASGKMLLSGNTDTNGKFDFVIPDEARAGKMDLQILLKAGTGHQATWTVKYNEYGAAKGPFAATEEEHGHKEVATSQGSVPASEVEAVVRRELEPVKRMLAEMHDAGPSVTEIIGGIGYIIGLFGIAAYMKSRKA
ncbi:hypothetical protein [Pseudodesulfovibrio sp. zrk46]|uniref:hypothetical protein n=1 Tax=Pseudodesulfovibrio sp. zrk46 TaxID=2725288 RepID=UPI0014497867|nr:hypothetical protein [Pseudodesulfovibrio sp. zrk46]QJB55379.1 hypothetical protein HFN16_02765 [Pseudodesulfovibrio sp. zrk46]